MTSQIVFLGVAVVVAVVLFRMLRAGHIREKYAALWLIVGAGIILVAAWPGLLGGLSALLGVAVPANLLFFASILLLLGVTLHLSTEASSLEDEVRTLAEEVALLRLRLTDHQDAGAATLASTEDEPHETEGES